jgi:HTH-type transcriptional regulator, competence development regulator
MGEFALFLKELRITSEYTQTQFAAKLGIDTAALSKIENGKRNLDPNKLSAISKEFNVDIDILKVKYFGEKIALELYINKCPERTLEVIKKKYISLRNPSNE